MKLSFRLAAVMLVFFSASTLRAQSNYVTPYTFKALAGENRLNESRDGTGINALFNAPQGLAVDRSGTIYVADCNNSTIRKITSGGVVTTYAGLAGSWGWADGTGSNAFFRLPKSVAVDKTGILYVADFGNQTIRKITSGGVVTTFAGVAGSYGSADGTGSAAQFAGPSGVAVDDAGNVYVADLGNYTIRKSLPPAS